MNLLNIIFGNIARQNRYDMNDLVISADHIASAVYPKQGGLGNEGKENKKLFWTLVDTFDMVHTNYFNNWRADIIQKIHTRALVVTSIACLAIYYRKAIWEKISNLKAKDVFNWNNLKEMALITITGLFVYTLYFQSTYYSLASLPFSKNAEKSLYTSITGNEVR
ncbi:hypothetical protein K0U07_01755 [bacterium]|nr:hypothetical protein [bacterium]